MEPASERPVMPGYGISAEPGGMLAWQDAEQRLASSHDYWVSTTWPDGRPHTMPVWGLWADGGLWFSSSRSSRKARNLAARPRATIATDNARDPVILDGDVEEISDEATVRTFARRLNAKYETDYSDDFYLANGCYRLIPVWAFALTEGEFETSPTRWRFGAG